jgi:hydrogenase nickel incorporation protein HypB
MTRAVSIVEPILNANDQLAEINRSFFDRAGTFALNVMASPGAGKTSLILETIEALKDTYRIGVVNGDVAPLDAEKVAAKDIFAANINTGGSCHLDARMVNRALPDIPLDEIDLLIIENVGNLICPAGFSLGTHRSVLVASIPEGDDKPYKYPKMYRGVDVLVVNKIDLLPYVPFDLKYFQEGVRILNPDLKAFRVSCVTQEGLDGWFEWLENELAAHRAAALEGVAP